MSKLFQMRLMPLPLDNICMVAICLLGFGNKKIDWMGLFSHFCLLYVDQHLLVHQGQYLICERLPLFIFSHSLRILFVSISVIGKELRNRKSSVRVYFFIVSEKVDLLKQRRSLIIHFIQWEYEANVLNAFCI